MNNLRPVARLNPFKRKGDKGSLMTSNGFTLADPNDRGMLDVVGFDTSVPAVISDFIRS